jgi:hypothetical protein
MKNIPSKVKIGNLYFDVKVVPAEELKNKEGKQGNGHTKFSTLEIRIADDMALEKQKVTYWHEVLHAMFEVSGLNVRYTREQEEEIIKALSHLLYEEASN